MVKRYTILSAAGSVSCGTSRVWGLELHRRSAPFETRPPGAPQDEDKPIMALRKNLILRRREASSRRTHSVDPGRVKHSSTVWWLNYAVEKGRATSMVSVSAGRHSSVTGRIEQVSGIRPVTLLIAFGIVLITAILIATGIAANGLRQQALAATESELGGIGSILAAAGNRSLQAVDAQLADIAEHVGPVGSAAGGS